MLGAVSINSWWEKTAICEKTLFSCQVLDGGGGLNKFLVEKTICQKKTPCLSQVLDVGGGLNKFLEQKNDILKQYVTKCHFS